VDYIIEKATSCIKASGQDRGDPSAWPTKHRNPVCCHSPNTPTAAFEAAKHDPDCILVFSYFFFEVHASDFVQRILSWISSSLSPSLTHFVLPLSHAEEVPLPSLLHLFIPISLATEAGNASTGLRRCRAAWCLLRATTTDGSPPWCGKYFPTTSGMHPGAIYTITSTIPCRFRIPVVGKLRADRYGVSPGSS
jgi:hypothetical protein